MIQRTCSKRRGWAAVIRVPGAVFPRLLLAAVFSVELGLMAQRPPAEPVPEAQIKSSKDGAQQPALFYVPPGALATDKGARVPLLVFLHSWSTDYKTTGGVAEAVGECRRRGWAFLSPDFRGVNDHPEACASDLAVEDVLDSVKYAKQQARVDEKRVYLLGSSGGGHMALVMAERAPAVWAAVSVWVPISDLAGWHQFSKATDSQYYQMMEKCCGGPPGTPETDKQYRQRSSLAFLSNAKGIRIAIDSGIRDGHAGAAVPLSQSLLAFNALATANGYPEKALAAEDIDFMTREARVPDHLVGEREEEAGRSQKIVFRRTAGPVRLTLFDGAHSVDVTTGIRWFE
jgi:pimeloyl-ACP methyl ester carboxylesterase